MKKNNFIVKVALVLFFVLLIISGCSAKDTEEKLSFASAAAEIVFITKTGEKYHREDCQYLRQSKIEISLEAALKNGYEPCSVCKPPRK